jgi:hypothetical protein
MCGRNVSNNRPDLVEPIEEAFLRPLEYARCRGTRPYEQTTG